MTGRKSFGQFCALARAMDRIGDRWTLLIVRELLIAPARYGELHAALPGLATNLLASRLRQLADDGIVERVGPAGAAYGLTLRGRELEPVLLALIRWGAVYMSEGPGDDVVDERWAVLALRAMLTTTTSGLPPGEVAVRCGGSDFAVVVDGQGRRVVAAAGRRPRATVTAPMLALLAAVSTGDWTADLSVDGDAGFARALLTPARASAPSSI